MKPLDSCLEICYELRRDVLLVRLAESMERNQWEVEHTEDVSIRLLQVYCQRFESLLEQLEGNLFKALKTGAGQ